MEVENQSLTPEQRQLAEYMRDMSQECYCAGWIQYLEYNLWQLLIGTLKRYGRCNPVEGWELAHLRQLSAACGGWIFFDVNSDAPETWVPLAEWEVMFAAWKKEHPELAAWKKEHPA